MWGGSTGGLGSQKLKDKTPAVCQYLEKGLRNILKWFKRLRFDADKRKKMREFHCPNPTGSLITAEMTDVAVCLLVKCGLLLNNICLCRFKMNIKFALFIIVCCSSLYFCFHITRQVNSGLNTQIEPQNIHCVISLPAVFSEDSSDVSVTCLFSGFKLWAKVRGSENTNVKSGRNYTCRNVPRGEGCGIREHAWYLTPGRLFYRRRTTGGSVALQLLMGPPNPKKTAEVSGWKM